MISPETPNFRGSSVALIETEFLIYGIAVS